MSDQFADLAARYRLDDRIAVGGMGVVWRGTDTRLGREVAVKVLKEEYADDPTFRARFDQEARSAASLHHPHIAGIFDYDADPSDGRAPYLVMEYVPGRPFSALLSDAADEGRRLDAEVVRALLTQAADGLAVAHRAGIVHRDVKPANLVVTADRTLKVTDFGIARAADASTLTRTGSVMGTPQYLSPEQARGEQATAASDVYSLGVVAYEALTGSRPFDRDSPVATVLAHIRDPLPELPDHVPAGLAAVVRRALAKEPADRFANAADFAAALRDPDAAAAAAPAATAVIPPTPAPPVERLAPAEPYAGSPEETRRRKPVWIAVLLVMLLVAAVVVIAVLFSNRDEEPEIPTPTPTVTDTTPTEATPTEPTETGPATIRLAQEDYAGRQRAQVESDLRRLGFEVTLRQIDNDGSHDADTVDRIDPHGDVAEGATITIHYYGPAPTPTEEPTEEPTDDETDDSPDITLPGGGEDE